jgi:hypothetical protein
MHISCVGVILGRLGMNISIVLSIFGRATKAMDDFGFMRSDLIYVRAERAADACKS